MWDSTTLDALSESCAQLLLTCSLSLILFYPGHALTHIRSSKDTLLTTIAERVLIIES